MYQLKLAKPTAFVEVLCNFLPPFSCGTAVQRKERSGKRGGGFDEDEEYLEQLSKQLAAQKLGVL